MGEIVQAMKIGLELVEVREQLIELFGRQGIVFAFTDSVFKESFG